MPTEKGRMFISYARADTEFALKLSEHLRSAGANIWLDRFDIPAGQRWDHAIQKALEGCECLLVILSPASVASDNVLDEVAFILDQNKQIVPVLHRSCTIPFRLARIQYIDLSGNYNDGLLQLIRALNIEQSERTSTSSGPSKEQRQIPQAFRPSVELRSEPLESFPHYEVKSMLKQRGFFNEDWHPKGKGVQHHYEAVECDGNKLVIDHTTGLTWQHAGAEKPMNFEEAEEYIGSLNRDKYAGFNNWRLPTLEEVGSLVEPIQRKNDEYINAVFDSEAFWSWVWTADKGDDSTFVWAVAFITGSFIQVSLDDDHDVLAVRSGTDMP